METFILDKGDEAKEYRWATPSEIAEAARIGHHILSACRCGHPGLWMHKGIALNMDGSYNGTRNIFYRSWETGPECACPGNNLRMVVPAYTQE